ncbi:MAG: bifunctional 23S rRNA (guanine(2069)-N(7))-methyltransferase RlmK/23S rRNA (guanine(2445)-N(2))-methyltransferase RlmL [Pseudomonadales bacterium]|nr:bifunctional 23S rRNA (guanine(2069)-N(7))-methyltransferase RlmK/23S rRNA (guanine(2445)-N(2))-methyltransferase RlmL [Pseudomonadales bacterium]
MQHRFFASCSKGLESLLETELQQCQASDIKQTVAGVFFRGSLPTAYRVIMFSRLANRLILLLAQAPVANADDLYRVSGEIDWPHHLKVESSFAIRAAGSTPELVHTQFIAQKIKDAIVDQFRAQGKPRPTVSTRDPELLIHAVIKKGQLTLGIDMAGSSLHRRNYRQEQGEAPLKETLAAALLLRAGWPQYSKNPEAVLYDPLCGSGTLLLEGLLMALDIAPGLIRGRTLSAWPHHELSAVTAVEQEAEVRRQAGSNWHGQATGSDSDPNALFKARRNAERAGLSAFLELSATPLDEAIPPAKTSLMISNPPYAERLGEEEEVMALYTSLGALMRKLPDNTPAAVFTAKPEWGKLIGIHSHRQYAFYNGALPARLLLFQVNTESVYQSRLNQSGKNVQPVATELDSGALMLANRLRKNLKTLGKWAQKNAISCYRLYDADMPEYAFAIDLYAGRVHMQEYKAPASVDEDSAARRRRQALQAVSTVLQIPPADIVLKVREKQRGKQQYQPGTAAGDSFTVTEGDALFEVNLQRYLDTGLFLDHRRIRHYIGSHAHNTRFLNLFCYTGAATVHAALGGARRSLSVDLSRTYLQWAERNFALNRLSSTQHELVQEDCLRFLHDCREQFDLIFLDPPTFSNSKSTDHDLDIQRDHPELIRLCLQRLATEGLLIFSTNHRRFRLDEDIRSQYQCEDFSRQSIDRDFARNQKIHQTWLIRQQKA